MPNVLRLSGMSGGYMYDKGIDKSYEQWKFLEKFKGWNGEFNKEILRVAEEEDVELREVFGKAISNILKNGEETEQIIQYATDCFSVGKISDTENVRLSHMKEFVDSWCKTYLVQLGEDFWQIKFAVFVGEYGESIVNYSKAKLEIWEIQFDEDTGEVIGWIKPIGGPMVDIEQLRGI